MLIVIVEDIIVTVKCRTAMFLYLILSQKCNVG